MKIGNGAFAMDNAIASATRAPMNEGTTQMKARYEEEVSKGRKAWDQWHREQRTIREAMHSEELTS